MKPLCIYHANCMDGFAAAWIAMEADQLQGGTHEYVPHQYGQPFDPSVCEGRLVYLLDYSFKLPVMQEIQRRSSALIVIDHHKTAEAEIKPLIPREGKDYFKFDMERSGAGLAWDYFFGGQVPELIRHIEDRDLWRFAMPNTEAVMDCVASCPYTFEAYSDMSRAFASPTGRQRMIDEGLAIGRYKAQQVATSVSQAREVELDGHKVLAVNMSVANLLSQIAGELSKGRPLGLVYFQAKEGHWVYSLRSQEDGIDVSELAKAHGGGGHKHAAGFQSEKLIL